MLYVILYCKKQKYWSIFRSIFGGFVLFQFLCIYSTISFEQSPPSSAEDEYGCSYTYTPPHCLLGKLWQSFTYLRVLHNFAANT